MTTGSCLCGEVTFKFGGELLPMSHCHCSMCRKIHGSLFATYLGAKELEYTAGAKLVKSYVSSSGFNRAFCKKCGSVLPETNDGGAEYYIPAGLLNEDPGIRPEVHIFTESKAEGYDINDDLPQLVHYGDGDDSRVIDIPEPAVKEGFVSGGCQCGDVEFEYEGTPKFMMNCHCSRCRKVKGAAHATNAFVPTDQFTWTKGQDKVVNYDLPEAERFGHAFCETCGSSLPRESAGTGMLNVPVGSLNSAPGVDAKGHIFMGSKAPWFEPVDDLPKWDEMPT